MFFVKIREKGKRKYWFVTSHGGTTNLKIHAGMIETKEKADRLMAEILSEYPEYEVMIVPVLIPACKA